MAKAEKRELRHEKEKEQGAIVPIRPTLTLPVPRWMERVEELFETRWAPLWPSLKLPEEMLTVKVPPLDVFEEGEALVVKAELPGLKKEEVEISLIGDLLTIAGKKETERKVERKDFHRLERTSGAFTRTVRLPFEVKVDAVTAKLEDGILEIRAPKTDEAKAKSRKIEIA